MTDTELIVNQAKKIAQLESAMNYYADRCKALENKLKTESIDVIPLKEEK